MDYLAMDMGREAMAFTPTQCATSMCLDREDLRPASTDFVGATEDPLHSML